VELSWPTIAKICRRKDPMVRDRVNVRTFEMAALCNGGSAYFDHHCRLSFSMYCRYRRCSWAHLV